MTECQGCGAWNDAERIVCVLCGTPLAETDEWDATADLPPLPPLPDGGLSASMPAWLREAPIVEGSAPDGVVTPEAAREEPALAGQTNTRHALGSRADPRTFLTDDDFPDWLRALAARESAAAAPPLPARPAASRRAGAHQTAVWPARSDAATRVTAPAPAVAPARRTPLPGGAGSRPPVSHDPPIPTAIPAGHQNGRRARSAWETLLLVILVLAVVGAALWALAANGMIGTGL